MVHKIDAANATAANEFASGPLGGTGTVVGPKWLNMVQRELVALVEAAGIALDDADDGQVLDALGPLLGRWMTLPAPYALSAGDGALVGDTFGVALEDALIGADVVLIRMGRHDLAAASGDTWTAGDRLFWDDSAKNVTTTAGGNRAIGVAAADKTGGVTVAPVVLDGISLS